jgi:hypothetical protein
MPDYRESDLEEARQLAPLGGSKQQERIVAALARRERRGAEKLERERELRLFYGLDEFEEVYGG